MAREVRPEDIFVLKEEEKGREEVVRRRRVDVVRRKQGRQRRQVKSRSSYDGSIPIGMCMGCFLMSKGPVRSSLLSF
jgi:hypothetical protein